MKRLVFASLLLLFVAVPFANAQCAPYACRVGSCPWTEILLDTNFNSTSCHPWSYTGAASATTDDICNWVNVPLALLTYNGGFLHTSSVSQTFPTLIGGTNLDNYSFSYIIEIDNLTPGDTVKVTITDTTTGLTTTTDTFTTDMWCNSDSHSVTGPTWQGHSLRVKWQSTLSSTGTTVKINGPAFWQEHS
jgi:hypothetical protein